jgi:hypothetical protein
MPVKKIGIRAKIGKRTMEVFTRDWTAKQAPTNLLVLKPSFLSRLSDIHSQNKTGFNITAHIPFSKKPALIGA